ncbi:hypothetical protein [Amycolatopsis mediterranei]|nr:hypothetical protein [Amycolatopsis mediterranei]AEK41418.1 hypothetical protein RAM_14650 [Amycolatopsis mediterranei S699]KDO06964.1 hypothetical protein DV26_29890 [Amycolatopsis mediterranei]KDU92686.1 hypothetical protein DV36_12160 [Amycolatopsis mediterranei]UZF69847.1 hypothetical protein ISP_003027 [Amycolatopsis mediterranei]
MHNRKRGCDENATTPEQIGARSGEELHRRATNAGSPVLARVIGLAVTGDRETFVRIVSLFILVVGAVVLIGTVLPWLAAAAAGGSSAWTARRARRRAGTDDADPLLTSCQ